MLAANNLIICAKNRFTDVEKSIKFLLQIITLVSSANNIGFAREFVCNGMVTLTNNQRHNMGHIANAPPPGIFLLKNSVVSQEYVHLG